MAVSRAGMRSYAASRAMGKSAVEEEGKAEHDMKQVSLEETCNAKVFTHRPHIKM